jgi:hypothetical protein
MAMHCSADRSDRRPATAAGGGFTMKRNLAALAAAALVTAPPASADPNLTAAEQRFVDAVYATGIPLAGTEIDLAMVGLDICDDQEHGEGNPRITSRLATSAGITLAQATVIVTDADAYLCSAPSR